MLLLSPSLAYTSFAKVALDGSFEDFLRDGYKNPGMLTSGVLSDQIAHARYTSMFTLGKKSFDKRLAAESFFFLECI